MKKLTAMLLSLVMCFSLLAIPAQAAFTPDPDPDSAGIIDVGDPVEPGDDGSDEPENSIQAKLPEERDDIPGAR